MKFQIKQGTVKIHSIQTLQLTDDVVCFAIDFKEKRVEYTGTERGSDKPCNITFCFARGDEDDEETKIEVILDDSWSGGRNVVSAVALGRYSAIVCLVRASELSIDQLPYWQAEN